MNFINKLKTDKIKDNDNISLNLSSKNKRIKILNKINKSVNKLNKYFNDKWIELIYAPGRLYKYDDNYDYEYYEKLFLKKEIKKYFLEKISCELEGYLLHPDNLEFSKRLGVDVPSFIK